MTMSFVTQDATKAADKDEVYRLTNMVVREVSVVDRAANKRTFLTYKAAAPGPELEPDGKGGFKVKAEKATDVVAPTPPTDPAIEEQAKAETPDPVLPGLEVPDDLVAQLKADVLEKVGRKVSREREQKLREAVALIMAVLSDSATKVEAAAKSLAALRVENAALLATNATELAKNAGLVATYQALAAEHETLKSRHADYVRQVHVARGTVPMSKVLRPEVQAQSEGAHIKWAPDLTREFHELTTQE